MIVPVIFMTRIALFSVAPSWRFVASLTVIAPPPPPGRVIIQRFPLLLLLQAGQLLLLSLPVLLPCPTSPLIHFFHPPWVAHCLDLILRKSLILSKYPCDDLHILGSPRRQLSTWCCLIVGGFWSKLTDVVLLLLCCAYSTPIFFFSLKSW